jgi:hypothetical protein
MDIYTRGLVILKHFPSFIGIFIPIGIFLLILIYIRYQDKVKKKSIKKLVTENNFNFEDIYSLLDFFGGRIDEIFLGFKQVDLTNTSIGLFLKGWNRKVGYVFSVPFNNNKIFFFDYAYDKSFSWKISSTHILSVAMFKSNNSVSPFYLRPEKFIDKIVAFAGYDDMDFENKPLFSKKYYLKSKDEIAARNLFSDTVIEFFENHPGYYAESNNNIIAIYKYSLLDTQNYLTFINDVKNILNLMKV